MIRKAKAVWRGNGRTGNGSLTTDSGLLADTPYSFRTRFENEKGTNPEELIAAAHAGCFTMALAFGLQGAGFTSTDHGFEWRIPFPAQGFVLSARVAGSEAPSSVEGGQSLVTEGLPSCERTARCRLNCRRRADSCCGKRRTSCPGSSLLGVQAHRHRYS